MSRDDDRFGYNLQFVGWVMGLPLAGKVILVTGAAKRVGAEIARRVHGAGAAVVLHYRSAVHQAEALVKEFNGVRAGSALAVQGDLLDLRAVSMVQVAVDRYGRLDGLVNNASSFFATPVGAIGEMQWTDIVGTNLKAPL